jgi:hypothetical protein
VNLTERGEPLEGISYITVEQLTIAAARLQ